MTEPVPSHVLVTGGTGFVGTRLCCDLLSRGYTITVLTRRAALCGSQDVEAGITYINALEDVDKRKPLKAVINLAGEPLNRRRWSASTKAVIRSSRVEGSLTLKDWICELDTPPECVLSASAIGWYGHWDNEQLDESSPAHDGFSHQLCRDWEQAATEGLPEDCRTCIVRIGIVLGGHGGPLKVMLTPARLGFGGPMGSGNQWWSWIHLQDLSDLFVHLLENPAAGGVFNATAPEPLVQREFAQTLGKVLHRPAVMPLPASMASLVLGEFAKEILLNGQRVLPTRTLKSGFEFKYPHLTGALKNLL